jgi:DNA end-binding protein Ku
LPATSERLAYKGLHETWTGRCRTEGKVGQEAFAVIRQAIDKEGMVALGRVVLTSREHVIALEPRGRRLLGTLLRYPYEVRDEKEYFADIPEQKLSRAICSSWRSISFTARKVALIHPNLRTGTKRLFANY